MYSPKSSNFAALDTVPVFSNSVLDASTMGDLDLQLEVIELFRGQFGNPADMFGKMSDAQEWRFAAHALRGTAAAIGALEVASLAMVMEEQGLPPAESQRQTAVQTLADAVARYLREVVSITKCARIHA